MATHFMRYINSFKYEDIKGQKQLKNSIKYVIKFIERLINHKL